MPTLEPSREFIAVQSIERSCRRFAVGLRWRWGNRRMRLIDLTIGWRGLDGRSLKQFKRVVVGDPAIEDGRYVVVGYLRRNC